MLGQFVTTIDYLNSKLYLKPYKNETFRFRYNLLGLELREVISGNFVVRFIFPELVAASSALQEGDIITSTRPSRLIIMREENAQAKGECN
jgi:hypothetical protein